MSRHCHEHGTNNCIECAIRTQTKQIVEAINSLRQPPKPKPIPLLCRIFGHSLFRTEPSRGNAGAMACSRCPYKTPGFVWKKPPVES